MFKVKRKKCKRSDLCHTLTDFEILKDLLTLQCIDYTKLHILLTNTLLYKEVSDKWTYVCPNTITLRMRLQMHVLILTYSSKWALIRFEERLSFIAWLLHGHCSAVIHRQKPFRPGYIN